MKCIYCGVDSKYKERVGGKCSKCHKRFAFEPKNGDPFTDAAFKAAIDRVSADGAVRWGVEHLYYELRRRRTRVGWTSNHVVAGIVVLIAAFSFLGGPQAFLNNPVGTGLVALAVLLILYKGFQLVSTGIVGGPTRGPHDDPEFNSLWQRWLSAHGAPRALIVRKEQPKRRTAHEPDITDYSFDRAVICDRARTVDLLVANNFHFENNCAVLSIGGYPQGPFDTVRTMLKRNPKLQVFALHDASVPGCRLAHRLANDPDWFKGQAAVTDIGLRPAHAKPYPRLVLSVPNAAVTEGEGITRDEARWLSEQVLELAVIRPEQVLKRLFRAINRKEQSGADVGVDGGSSGGGTSDGSSMSMDAGDSDDGADSFG